MRYQRVQHPLKFREELDKRLAHMQVGLLKDLAMASAATEVGGNQTRERPRCPTCEGVLQARGKQVRRLTTHREQTIYGAFGDLDAISSRQP